MDLLDTKLDEVLRRVRRAIVAGVRGWWRRDPGAGRLGQLVVQLGLVLGHPGLAPAARHRDPGRDDAEPVRAVARQGQQVGPQADVGERRCRR